MYVRSTVRFHFSFLISILAGIVAGCVGTAEISPRAQTKTASQSARAPLHIVFAIDISDSVCSKQRELELANVQKLLPNIGPGDTVEVFQISDVTAFAAPLFSETMPPPSAGLTRSKVTEIERRRGELKRQLSARLNLAFASPDRKINSTDVFSIFDRFKPDAQGRETRLVMVGDGLHVDGLNISASVQPVNMESMDFVTLKIATFVQRLIKRYRWSNTTLKGAAVYFLLPDGAACSVPNKGSATDLGRAYKQLVEALGGELRRFEPYLTGHEL